MARKIELYPATREPDHLAELRVAGSNPVVRSSKGAGQIGLCRLRRWPRNVPCHTRAIDALPPSTTTVGENDFNRFLRVSTRARPHFAFLAKVGLVIFAFKTIGAIIAFIQRFL